MLPYWPGSPAPRPRTAIQRDPVERPAILDLPIKLARLLTLLLMLFAPLLSLADTIDIEVKQLGVGNAWRTGETTGLLVELTNTGTNEEQVLVEWELPTPDGDITRYGRVVPLSPEQPRTVWLYGLLPYETTTETSMRVRASRTEAGTAVELLGETQFQARNSSSMRVDQSTGMLAVVGPHRVGLDQLSNQSGNINQSPSAANEATLITAIGAVDTLPDRWEGWRPYETIFWTNVAPDLRPSQLLALRHWIERGGHLVIVLPSTGTPWNIGGGNGPLGDLMPEPPRRDEQVSLSTVLGSITKQPYTAHYGSTPMRIFRDLSSDFNALPHDQEWTSVHALDDGRVWAVQRPVGHGKLSLIGLDFTVADQWRSSESGFRLQSLPDADVVWNRILGRRADTPNSEVLATMKAAKRLNSTRPTSLRTITDAIVSEPIAMRERAGRGLLLAFGFFLVYWAVAIPGTWWWLARRDKRTWAWAAYGVVAVVFSLLGWLLVELMQDRTMRARHLTVLDHVVRGDGQRVRSWFSLYWPGYSDREIELAVATGSTDRNLLQPWSPSESAAMTFPDSTHVRVDLDRRPDRSLLPGRGTATNLFADWHGLIDRSTWGNMLRSDPNDPVRLERDGIGRAIGLQGSIINDLPADLEHVRIMWVTGDRFPDRKLERNEGETQAWVEPLYAGMASNRGHAWGRSLLEAGRRLDLSDLNPAPSNSLHTFIEDAYRPPESNATNRFASYGDRERRIELEMLGLYHQLPPPAYHQDGKTLTKTGTTKRQFGRELDLSPWLSRPCLIITGFMRDSSLPLPLLVDGEANDVKSSGLTMVRWILPLPQHDPTAFDL